MTGLIARWRGTLETVKGADDGRRHGPVSITPAPHGGWRVALDGHIATVPDLVGIRYLARLAVVPNQDVAALALIVNQDTVPLTIGGQAVMDSTTSKALRERIRELRQQPVLSPSEHDEIEALTYELARAIGLGGQIRSFADVPERARTAVRKAIKRAIEHISAANPIVGRHLAGGIETGSVCRYRVEGCGSY
jgi:hypothetical protein